MVEGESGCAVCFGMKMAQNNLPILSAGMLQASFRVQDPNSQPREILVVPLGDKSAMMLRDVAKSSYRHARFLDHAPFGEAWRRVIGHEQIDLALLVAHVDENHAPAVAIGETCLSAGIKVSAVLLHSDPANITGLSAALRSLRPWTQTLAVISEADYIPGLLQALGA